MRFFFSFLSILLVGLLTSCATYRQPTTQQVEALFQPYSSKLPELLETTPNAYTLRHIVPVYELPKGGLSRTTSFGAYFSDGTNVVRLVIRPSASGWESTELSTLTADETRAYMQYVTDLTAAPRLASRYILLKLDGGLHLVLN